MQKKLSQYRWLIWKIKWRNGPSWRLKSYYCTHKKSASAKKRQRYQRRRDRGEGRFLADQLTLVQLGGQIMPTILLQGQSTQTVFYKLALRDRNMQVRFFWKVILKSWDLRNFASATSFCEIYTVRHLWSNLKTCKKHFGKKDFECNYCKATS